MAFSYVAKRRTLLPHSCADGKIQQASDKGFPLGAVATAA